MSSDAIFLVVFFTLAFCFFCCGCIANEKRIFFLLPYNLPIYRVISNGSNFIIQRRMGRLYTWKRVWSETKEDYIEAIIKRYKERDREERAKYKVVHKYSDTPLKRTLED